MQPLSAATAVSLALNLVLSAIFFLAPTPGLKTAKRGGTSAAAPSLQPVQLRVKTTTNTVTLTTPARTLDWRAIESEDYKKYISNLRAIGCPEKTVRDVIVADVSELFRQRYSEYFPRTNGVEYWKSGNPYANMFDETAIAKQQELKNEKRELIRTLLGSDYNEEKDFSAIQMDSFYERLLNFLTPEKRNAMKELEDKYGVRMMKTYKETWRGNEGPADEVRAEKDEEVLKILTPEEKLEYDLRKSDAAMMLRVALGTFELTEQEFRATFPAIKQFIAEAGAGGFGAVIRGQADPRPEAVAPRSELEKGLQKALGDDRFRQLREHTGWNMASEQGTDSK